MANLSALEKRQFEKLLGMGSGYVLNFTNNSFEELFRTAVKININDEKYCLHGNSKAKRMRVFWEQESDLLVGKILHEMLEIWNFDNNNGKDDKTFQACKKTVARLLAQKPTENLTENEFLDRDFGNISVSKLNIMEFTLIPILESRLKEAGMCLKTGSHLSVIFLCGSVLEGILLGVAQQKQKQFNQSKCAPKINGGRLKNFMTGLSQNLLMCPMKQNS